MSQLSNGRGIVAIEDGFAVAYATDGETEIGRLRLPADEATATAFILKYVPAGRGHLGVTASNFVRLEMMATSKQQES